MSLVTRLAPAAAALSLVTVVAACDTGTHPLQASTLPVPVFSFQGQLESVAAASPGDAWAVGFSGTPPDAGTVMVHWDGRRWSRVTSPAVLDGVPGVVDDVTVLSATDAWAVGFTGPTGSDSAGADKPLVLHWDGTRWSEVAGLPVTGALAGITMSRRSGWVVGASQAAGHAQPLIVRWDGAGWHRMPAPGGAGDVRLTKVAATSAGTAFAIGDVSPPGAPTRVHSELMCWNGSSWQWASFPVAGPANTLFGMAAGPDGTAWAVGQDATYTSAPSVALASPPLAMRWTGTTWQGVHVPGGRAGLAGVTVAPGGDVWAVGGADAGTLAMKWTGGAWAEVPVPTGHSPTANGTLFSVAFSSPTDGWAVGALTETGAHAGTWPLIVHCDGTSWN